MRLLLIAAIFSVVSTAAPAADTWFPFKDPNGAFSAEILGTPSVTTDNSIKAPDGSVIPTTTYEVTGPPDLVIGVNDFSKLQFDSGKGIDGAVTAVKASAVTIQLDQISVLDGQVGHEIAFIDKDGTHFGARIYFFQGHLYEIAAVTAKDATADEVAQGQHFLNSFHFTPSKT